MWQPNAYDFRQPADPNLGRLWVLVVGLTCLSACNLTPEVTERKFDGDASNWPGLLPQARLDALASGQPIASGEIDEDTRALQIAAEALRARAARLVDPVLTSEDRTRLQAAAMGSRTPAQ